MKSLFVIFGTLLLVFCLPIFLDGSRDAQTEDYTLTFADVETAAGVNSANVTLTQDIYDDNVLSVTAISSNETGDTPSAASYDSTSRRLTVNGLAANDTRTLSCSLVVDSSVLPTGASGFFSLFNWFYMFVILGSFGGAIYAFVQS